MQCAVSVSTNGKGLYPIDALISRELSILPDSGLLNLFVQHTSASLVIQENADPTARMDLEEFYERLVPEGESWYRHTMEGPDDTTSHIKASLTTTSLNVPIIDGKIGLGVWQGVYLFEHRLSPHTRKVILTVQKI